MDAVLIIIEKVGKSLSRVGLGTRLQYTLPRQCAHAFRPICCLFHYRLFVVASPLRRQALYFFDFVFVTESLACCHMHCAVIVACYCPATRFLPKFISVHFKLQV